MTEAAAPVTHRTVVATVLGRAWSGGRRLQLKAALALLWIIGAVLAAFFAPLPHNPTQPGTVLTAPSAEHWFGTDRFGFDVFSRTVASAAVDIPLALIGMMVSLVIGVVIGLLASSHGPWGERLMRGLDMFQAFPLLILAIAIVALMGNRIENVVFAIAIINVPRFIRLVRGEALTLRESRFIEAAHAIGAGRSRVMFRHLLPNMTGTILAQASLAAAHAIVVIAALSFLSIGVKAFDVSWGAMIRSGAQNMSTGQWWVVLFPGLAVFLTVLAFNTLAETTQRRFDAGARR